MLPITTMASVATLLASTPPAQDGFRPLFNGVDLAGWWGAATEDPRGWQALPAEELDEKRRASLPALHEHWRVEGGELVNDGAGPYLTTVEEFADFELVLELLLSPGADSGIYLRGIPQVQIWDTTEAGGSWPHGAERGSGGLWNNSAGAAGKDPLTHADRPLGEWNQVRIQLIGERTSVWLNETLVVDHARLENYFDRSLPLPRRGPIQLQTHGGEIRWRAPAIRTIEADEANALLAQRGDTGYQAVFDGESLDGWSGAVAGWEVHAGALRCLPGSGGTLFTDRTFDDFSARFEFKLPPGGNNGVAIRYPGEGDTAYVGMCELQVLDNTDERYAALDPRQYHGSVYGQVAAQRGYLRAVGEWNFQEIDVRGSEIRVELNGTRILDANVAEVTDFLHPAERFLGRGRTSGHFGFAGHGDAVEFRSVRIRPH